MASRRQDLLRRLNNNRCHWSYYLRFFSNGCGSNWTLFLWSGLGPEAGSLSPSPLLAAVASARGSYGTRRAELALSTTRPSRARPSVRRIHNCRLWFIRAAFGGWRSRSFSLSCSSRSTLFTSKVKSVATVDVTPFLCDGQGNAIFSAHPVVGLST